MKKLLLAVPLCLAFLLACNSNSKQDNIVKDILRNQYNRVKDQNSWDNLYKKASDQEKVTILNALSKTRPDTLLPWLKAQYTPETSNSIKKAIIKAVGQARSEQAEQFLRIRFKDEKEPEIKTAILKAFALCGTQNTAELIAQSTLEGALRKQALETAAILSRKKVDFSSLKNSVSDSLWLYNNLKESAYFIHNVATAKDITFLAEQISKQSGAAQKYYIRALKRPLSEKNAVIDSASSALLRSSLLKVLKNNSSWATKMYALQHFPHVADSADVKVVKKLTKAQNPNLKKEAFSTFQKMESKRAVSYLTASYKSEKSYSVKGHLVFLLAQTAPGSAFNLISKTLNEGPVSYKEKLLDALATYKNKTTTRIIKNFLQVSEKRLVNRALSILNKNKKLLLKDISALMHTENHSTMYMLIEYQKERKKIVDTKHLTDAFIRFNKAGSEEVQEAILALLESKKIKLTNSAVTEMAAAAATSKIFQKLALQFPQVKLKEKIFAERILQHLAVDSLYKVSLKNPIIEIVTNKGNIKIELYGNEAPATVQNMLHLIKKGFYNSLTFHRVVPDFVVQGGDPQGDGWGSAGYTIPSEDGLPFERGTIGIATSGFDTGSCQIFICQEAQPHLGGNYTAFGKVLSGMEVADILQIDDKIISMKTVN